MSEQEISSHVVVIKIGSTTVVNEQHEIDEPFIADLADQLARLKQEGYLPVVVSSGAVAVGKKRLNYGKSFSTMELRQAAAAAGQAALTEIYAKEFSRYQLPVAQVLLTRRELCERDCYLNARNTLTKLLELGAIPIINENDSVSTAEFSFGDNDMLGAIVATMLKAELYLICSDIDGLYTANPSIDPTAQRIELVSKIDQRISDMATDSVSGVGTGGMKSKIRAARACFAAQIETAICKGKEADAILKAVHHEVKGTYFKPEKTGAITPSHKLWIGLAERTLGNLYLDAGAVSALRDKGASLLPVGITRVEGDFAEGDVVNLYDLEGHLIARGAVHYSSEVLRRIYGLSSDIIERFIPGSANKAAVHRDDLLLF